MDSSTEYSKQVRSLLQNTEQVRAIMQQKLYDMEDNTCFDSGDKFKFEKAILEEDVQTLRAMKDLGCDFRKERSFPLVFAAHHGKLESTRFFLEEVKLNIISDDFGAFRNSIMMNQNDVSKYLATHKMTNEIMAVGLVDSAANGNFPMVSHLITNYAYNDMQLEVAFDMAAINERKEVATYLYSVADDSLRKLYDHKLDNWGGAYKDYDVPQKFSIEEVKEELKDMAALKNSMDRVFGKTSITAKDELALAVSMAVTKPANDEKEQTAKR